MGLEFSNFIAMDTKITIDKYVYYQNELVGKFYSYVKSGILFSKILFVN